MNRLWQPIVEPLVATLNPNDLLEIGADTGAGTVLLLRFAVDNDCTLHSIDVDPKFDAESLQSQNPDHFRFHQSLSLDTLEEIGPVDVVLIDGDHNWYSVFEELKLIESIHTDADRPLPLILLHDVGWPYGRRDLYYSPERIPEVVRHPHEKAGLRPGQSDLDRSGGLNSHLHNAVHEGGPRNGVLTAVEDYIAQSNLELVFHSIPAVFGLGILFPKTLADSNPRFARVMSEIQSDRLRQLAETVERLRLEELVGRVDGLQEIATTAEHRDQLLRDVGAKKDQLEAVSIQAEELQRSLTQSRSELEAARGETRHAQRTVTRLTKSLASEQRRYKRLRSRRSVQLSLAIASLAQPLFRFVRRLRKTNQVASVQQPEGTEDRRRARRPRTSDDEKQLAAEISRRRAGDGLTEGPLVSIIILSRNGKTHLQRLFDRLQNNTDYRSFEVIVVDNGSSDGTQEFLRQVTEFPCTIIRNEHNSSFSEGNNQGADQAAGEYLLLLNNDVAPINPGWLGSCVELLEANPDVAATGSLLVYPIRGDAPTDLTVQHRGIALGLRHGAVHASNIGWDDPTDRQLEGWWDVEAATAAALMMRSDDYAAVGGLDTGYVYGVEDVDLCLQLRDRGRIVVNGGSALMHHESATQSATPSHVIQANRRGNWQRFAEKWAPTIVRTIRRDALHSGRGAPRKVAITLTQNDESAGWGDYYTAHELGNSFERAGWQVHYAERYKDRWLEMPPDTGLVISLLDSYDVRSAPVTAVKIAWVRNWVDRWLEQDWFEHFDLVVVSSSMAASAVASQSVFPELVLPLATNPDRFHPELDTEMARTDFVFTGNNWGVGREIVTKLDVRADERFAVYGKGWDDESRVARYRQGHIPYSLLPEVYASTSIVLDDTAGPTISHGFLNGRVFDALASGALVLTDNAVGSEEVFEGKLPVYTGRKSLRTLLDRYLENGEEREALVATLRSEVTKNHTYTVRQQQFVDLAIEHVEKPRIAINIGVPNNEVREQWGDTHFANALASALTKLGAPTRVQILPEWDDPSRYDVDVVIHLRGLSAYTTKPGHINVMWLISHPDDVSIAEIEKYDLVFVASQQVADELSSETSVPVHYMPQATDSRRFHPREEVENLVTDLLFVGNSRGQTRPGVDWAIQEGLPIQVFGQGWEGRIPPEFVEAEYFPNENLGSLYSSAKIVLNDHWPDMRERGFVSNRVFDALACGTVVVSDDASGLRDLLGDLVPTYSSATELQALVVDILGDGERRRALETAGSETVLRNHTFDARAATILASIGPLLAKRRRTIDDRFTPVHDDGSVPLSETRTVEKP